jgi:hypothetical protein
MCQHDALSIAAEPTLCIEEYLCNNDLVIPFTTCLTDFVARNSEISMSSMEDLVSLLATLQVNLEFPTIG